MQRKRRTFDKITAAEPMNRVTTKLSPRIIKPNRTFFTLMAANEADGKIQEVMRLTFFLAIFVSKESNQYQKHQ